MSEYKITEICDNCNQKFDITISKIYKSNYKFNISGTRTFNYTIDCPHCNNKYYIPKNTMNDLVSAIPNNKDDNCEHDMYYFNCYNDGLYENSHSKCMKCGGERVRKGYNYEWINEDDNIEGIGETIGMLLVCLTIVILLFIGCNIGY